MKTQLTAQVEKLIAWRIGTLGDTPSADDVLALFKRANFNAGKLPDDITGRALRSFRQRSDAEKRKLIERVRLQQSQAQLPNVQAVTPAEVSVEPATSVSETLPASVTDEVPQNQPVQSDALAEASRKTSLELVKEGGEVYITLRCFEKLIGKRPDNLRRSLEARHLEIRDVVATNERGQLRPTPAIQIAYVFAVVMLADLHGMDADEREKLFAIQRDLPGWMKRFEAMIRPEPPALPLPPAASERSLLGSVANTIMGRLASAFTTGLSKLEHRLDVRFDRLERLLHQYTSPPAPSPSQNGAHVDPRWARLNGTGKISSRPPHKDVLWVTTAINNALGTTTYTPEDIIRIAQRERIYDGFWVMDKVGIEPAIILDDGEKVTKWFDQDAIELLKDVTRKETVAQNSAPA